MQCYANLVCLLLYANLEPAGVCCWLAVDLLHGIGGLLAYEDDWRLQIGRLQIGMLLLATGSQWLSLLKLLLQLLEAQWFALVKVCMA
ncbi:unnamed protein product [Camellia sinensis]